MTKTAEFYGSTKFMPEDILSQRLKKAQDDIAELSAEKERRAAFTPEMKLCDRLHRLWHFGADCDYLYSDWPDAKGCRHEHLMLTYQLLHTLTLQGQENIEALQILDALLALMERQRFGSSNSGR